jgi:zinc protease
MRFTGFTSHLSTVSLVLTTLFSAVTAANEDPALQAASALYEGIRVEKLDNGLRVYLKPIKGSLLVTTMMAYRVGSADENLDATGLSHYLEHLMFKGTNKLMPGDIDRLTQRGGGQNNAYTSEDYTIYHFDFSADRWDTALQIEADRMRNLRIDAKHEFQQEKGAVIEELQRNEDSPWDLEEKAILPLLFGKTAPYGHPVIGERQHVRGATAEVIKAHYDHWYHPNNAALVVVGGFDAEKALARIKELFGPLKRAELPERKRAEEPKRTKPVEFEFPSKFELPRMIMGYNTVRSADADAPVLDVIQAMLTGGRTGRLYKKLVEGEEVATYVSTTDYAGRHPGWFSLQVELLPDKSRKNAEQLVLKELQRLREEPTSDAELKRAKRMWLTEAIFARESVHGLADSIARGIMVSDLDHLKSYLPRIMAVTADDVQRVAKKYFEPDKRVVVWSVPRAEKKEGGLGAGRSRQQAVPSLTYAARRQLAQNASEGSSAFSFKNAKRVELPNGLVLLLLENHRLPIIVADASVRHVQMLEPPDKAGVAALIGNLLDEGTAKHSSAEIAEMIENVGGTLAMSSSGGSVHVLAPQRTLGLELLFECLSQPTFPKDAFNRQKERLLAEIDDAERRPGVKARQTYRELLYGKHPLGRPALGFHKTVEKLTPADCAAFHRQMFVPNNTTVAVVGDFNSDQIVEEIKRLTADWKKADVAKLQSPPVEKPKEFTEKTLQFPEAAQLAFYMGHPGVRRNNPDYYKLLVMDYVLGTGSGFTDRLSARLRDRQGLAYTVEANITSSAGEEPGLFTCYVGTAPQNFEKVKSIFLEEIERLRTNKPTQQEVEDAKNYLINSLPLRLTTSSNIATQLLYIERYGLGLDFLDDYRRAVERVTPEDVREVAAKYLDPKHMVLVAAGAIGPDGKPLQKLPAPKK